MKKSLTHRLAPGGAAFFLALATAQCTPRLPAASTAIAKGGKALVPIVVSTKSTADDQRAASDLASMLRQITGADFAVRVSDTLDGIVVGTTAEFPKVDAELHWDPENVTQKDSYLLRTDGKSLYILGASGTGVNNGVWGFLHRLGYRQYFPGPLWEIVPHLNDISADYDAVETPSYFLRRLFIGFGTGAFNEADFRGWLAKNRMTVTHPNDPASYLRSSDAYSPFITRHKKEFDAHPEWQGKDAKGKASGKIRFSSLELRALFVKDTLDQFAAHPDAHSLSMTASDGAGWIDDPGEKNLGSYTDRVVGLADEVANAVAAKYPDKVIGLGAYDVYSEPPSIPVAPNIVVDVATQFVHGGYTPDQLIKLWKEKAARVGVRDYFGVWGWDHDLPGQALAANPTKVAQTLARYHDLGAQFYNTESENAWAPEGLGFYVAAQTLWNVDEAKHVPEITDEFITNCFGSAKGEMAKFYALIDGKNGPLPSLELAAQMNTILVSALAATNDPQVKARIDELIDYTHYIPLALNYIAMQSPGEKEEAGKALRDFAYKARAESIVHSLAIERLTQPGKYDLQEVKAFAAAGSDHFTQAETDAFAKEFPATTPDSDVSPAYSQNLVPAAALAPANSKPGSFGYLRGSFTIYTVATAGQPIRLTVTGGVLDSNDGPVHVALLSPAGGAAMDHADVPPDKQPHAVELHSAQSGLVIVKVDDSRQGMKLEWPAGQPMSFLDSRTAPPEFAGRCNLYFFVPSGTRELVGYSTDLGDVLDSSGAKRWSGPRCPEIFHIPVPAGQDGRFWKFSNSLGQKILVNVPPYVALNPNQLLVPAEASH